MSEGEGLSGVKVLAMMGVLFLFWDAVAFFYGATPGNELFILWGILELVFAIVIFLGLKFWDLIPFSLPFTWWILLIIGVVTLIIGIVTQNAVSNSYWAGTIVTMAGLIDLFGDRKGWKASKIMALLGAAFGIYDCIIIFMGSAIVVSTAAILNGVFGLILGIILIIIIFDLVDIKVPYEWWVLMIIGFVFFFWVISSALAMSILLAIAGTNLVIVGFSGMTILIAFVLLAMGF